MFDTFTAVLNSSEFPFVSSFLQRTVLIPGIDQPPRIPRSLVGDQSNSNTELAQHFYCENVLPSAEGLSSVGYNQIIAALLGATDFDSIFTLRDVNENDFLFTPALGKNYIYTANHGGWLSTNPIPGVTTDTLVTRAFVGGRTFICYQGIGVFEYNTVAGTFLPVALTGIVAANIDGIFGSNNYLIAFTGLQLNWSSLIDPTDFTSNITTGAGFATPQDVKGPIRAGMPISGGFIVYTNKNAVVALYTNNARAPWVFREVSSAGGVHGPDQLSADSTLAYHFAWTTAGLQRVAAAGAETVSPAATDYLGGRIQETFDPVALALTTLRLSSVFKIKVAYVASRFLVVSYGVPTASPQLYTHAIVLDTALKRWGKLKITHVGCFSFPYPNLLGEVTDPTPKNSIGFLQQDGTVQLLVQDYRERSDAGVLFLGRFQHARQIVTTFQFCELEGLHLAYPPSVYFVGSYDGMTMRTPAQLPVMSSSDRYARFGSPAIEGKTGKNFSLLITGTFELTTAMFTITRHGKR